MRISNLEERHFYEIETYKNNWSVRELNRQFDSALYERLALSKNKEKVIELSNKGQIIDKPEWVHKCYMSCLAECMTGNVDNYKNVDFIKRKASD